MMEMKIGFYNYYTVSNTEGVYVEDTTVRYTGNAGALSLDALPYSERVSFTSM